ncbi:MAG: nuclear transport factor 2 family protein [Kordiimonadaceae bacterium]|nr:nuclear transport factor 2 family protein [Kordiimonadaceae bacterium]
MPDYVGKYSNVPAEIAAIEAIVDKFQKAIIAHDGAAINALLLHDDILFISAAPQKMIDRVRELQDPDYMKKRPSGQAQGFVKFVSESKMAIEERFYNVKITEDSGFALVVFDYDFRMDGTVTNYGIETWQMFKVDGIWRIATVAWSATPTGKMPDH